MAVEAGRRGAAGAGSARRERRADARRLRAGGGAVQAAAGPGTGTQRHYAWDRAGAPVGIDDLLWGATRYGYDANGQVAEARFGDGASERFSYDAAKTVAGVRVEGPAVGPGLEGLLAWRSTPGGVVQLARGPHGESIALTHDACGRVITRRVERRGFRPKTWRYGWDAHDRLVRCDNPEGETWTYGYDPFGRRLTKVRHLRPEELSWTAQRHPALVSAGARATTQIWTWPAAPPGSGDAGDGRPPVVGTHFTWDGDVVAEEAPLRLDGVAEWDAATRWHYEPGGFVPLAKQTAGGELLPIVVDHLGTPREMFDEAGDLRWAASYTTWGVVRGVQGPPPGADNDDRRAIYPREGRNRSDLALQQAWENSTYDCPLRFQGQWADNETALYYNRNRAYDPLCATYISIDPIRLFGGFNLYSYVENPIVAVDTLGLSSQGGSRRGPKTSDLQGQNPKIIEERQRLESQGKEITGGGRVLKERAIKIDNGYKGSRRPDISYKDPAEGPDGPERGVNIGKTNADGSPISRKQKALDDFNGQGYPTTFVPYP